MRRGVVVLVSLVAVLFIALITLLSLPTVIRLIPLGYLPAPLNTPVFCSSMPDYDPGQYVIAPETLPQAAGAKVKYARVIDLDPTIPVDSKVDVVIRRRGDEYEWVYYSTQEQREEYLKSLHIGDCWLDGGEPACLMGHYAGEPPGRQPCIVPTPKVKTPTPILPIR